MKQAGRLAFKGTLRDYQQQAVDQAGEYLKDNRIHIVAAPGSGKTILGLELICRLNKPALVLAPTVTIRQQWGSRFTESFLQPGDEGLISDDLKAPSFLTCSTYQGLHAAYNRQLLTADTDDEEEAERQQDFSGFDLISCLKQHQIGTICLDEAHHLRSEWHKALTAVIEQLGSDIKIISLTATPPYDSTPEQWQKYIDLCGPVDMEIGVPQLVASKILCPHQDYVYFAYPTQAETEIINAHNQRAEKALQQAGEASCFSQALISSGVIQDPEKQAEIILDNPTGFMALGITAAHFGTTVPEKFYRLISPNGKIPEYDLEWAQKACQLVIDQPQLWTPKLADQLFMILAKANLINARQVQLTGNERISRLLASSIGKLTAVKEIAEFECQNRKEQLRMLILTDFIKKEQLEIVGTDQPVLSMGAVPLFETVRRGVDASVPVGLLSGELVVLPDQVISTNNQTIATIAGNPRSVSLNQSGYSQLFISGGNKVRVALMTKLFTDGAIQILIGTKSLLGEGWDAPCINALILASFVGSFMLSNQMRGRAIRIDRQQPNKTADIWHLVTVQPARGLVKNQLTGPDWTMMKRRFEAFLGPAYDGSAIESGIERLTVIKPPYDRNGLDNINQQMLKQASQNEQLTEQWTASLKGQAHPQISDVVATTNKVVPSGYAFYNVLLALIYLALLGLVWKVVGPSLAKTLLGGKTALVNILAAIAAAIIIGGTAFRLLNFATPLAVVKTMGQAVLETLQELNIVTSPSAEVEVQYLQAGSQVYSGLVEASVHDQTIFAQAMAQLLSPIDNPRYLLIGQKQFFKVKRPDYRRSYACPEVLGNNKTSAAILARKLKRHMGAAEVVYTRSQQGRSVLLQCRQQSYMNHNEIFAGRRQQLASRWR